MDLSSSTVPCKGEMELEDGGEEEDAAAAEKDIGKPRFTAASPPPPPPAVISAPPGSEPKYWECMRNHAAALGLHASDGCGEFIPAGRDLDAYRCAACGCHRNFHRRDHGGGVDDGGVPSTHLTAPYHHLLHSAAAASGPSSKLQYSFFLHHPSPMASFPAPGYRSGGSSTPPPHSPPHPATAPALDVGVVPRRRRCRTMFTREQKEEMRKFADKVGWSIQRHDGEELREFCARVGVRRHVLKVWMHNNKGTLAGAGSSGPSKIE